ncbi:MAG TPA: ADP-forming succinate--CoA ligase subunit beta [Elusimicrobiales bacterium]|nr:ADP-forming succinate--CoA ligase subunit beta [Elusimicrobiales bacterium]HOL62618.1 ADP-forming succinate--CoA ligase subunit beta [Elusimicrobiales bacterium]HPO94575.1 ADP-forming succinate--CoA ligase subunit beta [Elusimicrobiales bacterium]
MKLVEYEGKDLFIKYSIPTAKRYGVVKIGEDISKLKIDEYPVVIKAQVLAGGRGKAGGVKIAKNESEAKEIIKNMLGMTLVTHQTGGKGIKVEEVLVEKANDIEREIYISVIMDRKISSPTIIASKEGGMSIEELAKDKPELIIKMPVDVESGLMDWQARELAYKLDITDKSLFCEFTAFAKNLVKVFINYDANLVEVNPLIITKEKKLIALDSKVIVDDNSLFRHKDIASLPDRESSELEKEAKKIEINYIGLDGSVGCMVNGAGLAMATLDTIKLAGGDAANFLDVGGGANVEQITNAFKIILKDPKVKAVLVNIFGGIMKCDNIAKGIVEAAKNVDIKVPVVVRLEGTNVKEGKEILKNSGLKFEQADSLWDGCKKAVALCK